MSAPGTIRGLPRTFWFLWLGILVNRLGGFVVPFLALYLAQERGFPVERAGLAASLFGMGSLCAGPLGGWLADRYGRRPTMVLGLIAGAAAMVHLGLARAPLHIELAALLLGLLGDIYRPALWAAAGDLLAPGDRPRGFGLIFWAVNLGFAGSAMLAGALAAGGFWVLFLGDAATTLGMAVVIWFLVPESRPPPDAAAPGAGPGLLTALRDRVFSGFICLSFLAALLFMQFLAALPLTMKSAGLGAREFGFLIALNGIEIALLQPFAARVTAGHRRSRVLALALTFAGLGFGLTAFAHTPLAFAATITLWTLGEILMAPNTAAIVSDLAPQKLRATYQGLQQMSWSAAFSVAPALGTLLLGRAGPRALWLSCLLVGLLCATAHLALGPARARQLTRLRGVPVAVD